MKISLSIMTHPKRFLDAEKLYMKLKDMGFSEVRRVLDHINYEWDTGKRSLLAHRQSDWHIILQDDAIIGDNFFHNAVRAINTHKDAKLISFYTGTSRPLKSQVQRAVDKAREQKASWLTFGTLNWGVGFAIKTDCIEPMLS